MTSAAHQTPVGARTTTGGPGVRPVLGIARDGWPILALFALGAAGAWTLGAILPGWWLLAPGIPGTLLFAWCAWFFRDPERAIPVAPGLVLSGADGVVCFVGPGRPPSELELDDRDAVGMTRVSVFMDLMSVHVNRSPVRARVESVAYRPGAFFNASLDKASERNERLGMSLRMPDGRAMVVVQIAGLVARRIVCRVKEGMELAAGERFGMIRFGSRVDVYLPAGVQAAVKQGDHATAGVTVLARLGGSVA
jgi:phosphatidylserine decarboxylase